MEQRIENDENFEKAAIGEPKNLRLIFKLLIGFGAGLLSSGIAFVVPLIGLLTAPMLFFCVLVGLIVYGLCDRQGLAAFIVTFVGFSILIGGPVYPCVMLLAVAIPLALMAIFDIRGVEFFKRLYLSLGVELLGLLLSLGVLVLI